MKKIMIILGFSVALLACSKVTEPVDSSVSDCPITLNLSIGSGSPDTKSIKTDWDNGDKVHIFFKDYVNSDCQYLTVAYDKTGSVTGTKYTWYVHEWHGGLDKVLLPGTSGLLAAFYSPNDKVDGSVTVSKASGGSYYNILPKDRKGNNFYSHYTYGNQFTYTIDESGVLSADITMRGKGYYTQYCIDRDANGNAFTNANAHRYTLKVGDAKETASSKLYTPSFYPDGSIEHSQIAGYDLSAYFYGGLCFSDLRHGVSDALERRTIYFILIDNNGTPSNTADDKRYAYSTSYTGQFYPAVKLPDLNAVDSEGYECWQRI